MSGYLRFCFVSFLLAGFSTSPASADPFDALFNSAPAETAAPTPAPAPAPAAPPAEEGCLPQPGKSTADGQHWVYRYDGHRKCWFQAAEASATVKKSAHHAAKHRAPDTKENDTVSHSRRAVVDARTELLSPTPTEAPQPTPPAPELKLVEAAPVPVAGDAALVQPAPVVAKPTTDRLTVDQPVPPRQVDVEALLAAAPSSNDAAVSAVSPTSPAAVPSPEVANGGGGWTATWAGLLLMALGLVLLLRARRTVRVDRAEAVSSPSVDEVSGHRSRWAREPAFSFAQTTFAPLADERLFKPRNARPAI
jgi:hypothetical protein